MVVEFPGQKIVSRGNINGRQVSFGRPVGAIIERDDFVEEEAAKSHAAEPIKDVDDILRVQEYLISAGRYRDNLIFTCGINFGLRAGDLLSLKVGHLVEVDDNGNSSYKSKITLSEQKTNKRRIVYVNDAVMDAADLYFTHMQAEGESISLNDYLFKTNCNRTKGSNQPMAVRSLEDILKEVINDKCGLDIKASTHCLRKTFAYQVIMTSKNRDRAIEFLQKILGHSSQAITLRYAGITDDEIRSAYQNLNLGGFNVARSAGLCTEDSGAGCPPPLADNHEKVV